MKTWFHATAVAALACACTSGPKPQDLSDCEAVFETDDGADGSVDSTQTDTYDAEGRVIEALVQRSDGSGSRTVHGFDAAGCLTSLQQYLVVDGEEHLIAEDERTCDENGDDLTVTSRYSFPFNGFPDSVVEQVWARTYDDRGRSVGADYTYDLDGQRVTEGTYTYTWDGDRQVGMRYTDASGTRHTAYTYEGDLWVEGVVTDDDGNQLARQRFTFDDWDREVRRVDESAGQPTSDLRRTWAPDLWIWTAEELRLDDELAQSVQRACVDDDWKLCSSEIDGGGDYGAADGTVDQVLDETWTCP